MKQWLLVFKKKKKKTIRQAPPAEKEKDEHCCQELLNCALEPMRSSDDRYRQDRCCYHRRLCHSISPDIRVCFYLTSHQCRINMEVGSLMICWESQNLISHRNWSAWRRFQTEDGHRVERVDSLI